MSRPSCPGLCGRTIPIHLYACSQCWNRLPRSLRTRIEAQATAVRQDISEQITTFLTGVGGHR